MSDRPHHENLGWDRASLAPLDAALARLDADRDTLEPAVYGARRSGLYAQLAAFGLGEPLTDDQVQDLGAWGLDALRRRAIAVRELAAWARSPERAARLGDTPVHVAADLFRFPQEPAVTPALLASIEDTFVFHDPEGPGGTVFLSQGSFALRLSWVREGGISRIYGWS